MLKKSSLENTGEECPVLILRERVQGVRLKLAFCTTCAVRVLVLAQGPSFVRLKGP